MRVRSTISAVSLLMVGVLVCGCAAMGRALRSLSAQVGLTVGVTGIGLTVTPIAMPGMTSAPPTVVTNTTKGTNDALTDGRL